MRRAAPAIGLLSTFVAGGPLNTAAYSADGSRIITASRGGTAEIFAVASGRPLLTLTEPQAGGLGSQNFSIAGNALTAASFSADGRLAVTASLDSTARVWEASRGRQLEVFPVQQTVNDAQFNANAGELVTADEGGRAAVWQPGSPRPVRAVHEPAGGALATAVFSPDGRSLLTASSDGTARVWDLATGAQSRVLREPGGQPLNDASFSPDGRRIVTASTDGTARIWDAASGTQLITLGARSGSNLQSARFSPDGNEVVTAGNGPTVTVWDAATGEQLTLLQEPQGPRIDSAAFSADGGRVLTASNDGTARIWSAFPRQLLASLRTPDGSPVNAVAFGRGGAVAFGGAGGTARIAKLGARGAPVLLREGTGGANFRFARNGINAVAFSADGRRVLTGSDDGTARIWDPVTGRMLIAMTSALSQLPVFSARFLPGDRQVLTLDNGGAITLFSAASGRQLAQCYDPSKLPPIGAAISPSGTVVAVAGRDGTARLLALPTATCSSHSTTDRQLAIVREPLGSPIGSVAFSPDGRRLLTASNDGTARIWDLRTGAVQLVVRDPAGSRLYAAAFSPDGGELVTVDGAGTATIWDARTGKQLTSVGYAQGARMNAVAYSADGRELITSGFDGRASVWSAALAAPLTTVRRIALARVRASLPRAELASYQRQIHG